jgi:uncharacterized membrane protein YozB (DUF420 family)
MAELKILRRCFAYAAFVFALMFIATIPVLVRAPFPHTTSRFHAETLGILLIVMREMILLMPPLVAVVNGMAWWAAKNGRSSARHWAMAASTSFLILSLPFFVADVVMLQNSLFGAAGLIGVFVFAMVLSSVGLTGLAVFSRYGALIPASVSARHI